MQVQANSIQYLYSQMQALMGAQGSTTTGTAPSAGQDVPGGSAVSTGTSSSATTSSQPAASGAPSSQFSSAILSSLISLQSNAPSASNVANEIITSLGGSSSGGLNLSEFEQALGGSSTTASGSSASSSSSNNAALASAFNTLDTNGDGEISSSELTTELQTALQSQSAGGHHHHGHHHAETSADSSTDGSSTTTGSSGSTTSTGSSGATTAGATVAAA